MKRDRILTVLSFLAIHLVWGSTYLAIRYSIQTIPPLITAGLRHIIGGSVLLAWCWSRGYRPTLQQWRASAIVGIFFFLLGHGSLHWAELVVPSGVAALLMAVEPVWVAALSAISADRLRLSPSGMAGLFIGVIAVAMLVGRPAATVDSRLIIGSFVVVFSGIAWSVGMIYSRTAPLHPMPIMSAAMSLLCGGVLLIAASFVTGSAQTFHFANVSLVSAVALTYLIVFGALTFAGYTFLLTRWPPVLVATHAYTNPLIAVALGAIIAGEHVTVRIIVAAVAILIAILLVRRDTVESRAYEERAIGSAGEAHQRLLARSELPLGRTDLSS